MCFSNLFAQVDNNNLGLSNEQFFEKSDYIVEGKLISVNYGYDVNGNYNPEDIFTEYKFKVDIIYKSTNNLIKQRDTIVVIANRGWVRYDEFNWYDSVTGFSVWSPKEIGRHLENNINLKPIDLDIDNNFILFLNKTDLPINPNNKNNYFHCQFLQDREFARIKFGNIYKYDTIGLTMYHRVIREAITGLNGLDFPNRYELYKYMEKFEGVKVPLSNPGDVLYDLNGNIEIFNQYRKERNIDYKLPNEKTQEEIDSFNRFLEEKSKKAKENTERKKKEEGFLNGPKSPNELTITIQNQRVEYNNSENKYYFKFKVYAQANNSSTYLDNVAMKQ